MKQMGQWAYNIFMKRCFPLKEQVFISQVATQNYFKSNISSLLLPFLPALRSSELSLNILKVEQDSKDRRGEEREPWRQTFLCRIWYLDPKPLYYKLNSKFIFVFSFETSDQVNHLISPLDQAQPKSGKVRKQDQTYLCPSGNFKGIRTPDSPL